MDAFLLFFEQMPTWQKIVWVSICLGFSWVLEGAYPLVRLTYRKWRHAGVNSVFLATSLAINVLFGVVTVGAIAWVGRNGFGLLYLFDLPVWVELLIALIVLDFVAQYFVHYLLHHVRWMWRFHAVHHSDRSVDATTGARLHPGDYLVREVFALAATVVVGAPIAFYLVYRIATIFFTFVTHANVAAPRWVDAPLSWVLVTPNMHKFHHHFERPWTDTNYGGILSVWDRVFGTFVYGDPRAVRYGLDIADETRNEDVMYQMALPFGRSVDREAG